MSAVENSLGINHYRFEQNTDSIRIAMIGCFVVATLAALMIVVNAWSTVKVASLYGAGALLQHSIYTHLIPLTVILIATRILILFIASRQRANQLPALSSGAELPSVVERVVVPPSIAVSSPMPGQCCSVRVQVGDTVRKGDVLCVIECMKMEMTIRAEKDGRVTQIFAKEGEELALNQPIVHLEEI